ncbi:MAG: hypothetical protein Aurels2KO_08540 [Aureliella sp.]
MQAIGKATDWRGLCGLVLALLSASFVGCSTHARRLATPRSTFYANRLPTARAQLEKLVEKPKGDATVVQLDLAMVDLFSGDPARAESRLREVRDQWDRGSSKLKSTASLLTDDSKTNYSGEDYEQILVRFFLTLCSMMGDRIDAQSYSLQTLTKQREIVGLHRELESGDFTADDNYCIPAVAPYVRGVLREATHSNYDDALRSYKRAKAIEPLAAFLDQDIQRVTSGRHSQRGNGVVYVIAMVGQGPRKEETSAQATQQALLLADQIVSAVGQYSVPPTIAPVKVPTVISGPKPFDLIGIEVAGQPIGTTLPITDLHQMALQSMDANMSQTIARAVARRVIKKGAVYAAKDKLGSQSDITSLVLDAAGVAWEATESADTRCWGLLPREIQIARVELPAGAHRIHLEPIVASQPVASGTTCDVNVSDGKNSYVLGYWPGLSHIGNILVSD